MLGFGCGRAGSALVHRNSLGGYDPRDSRRLAVDAEVAVIFHEFINIDLCSQGWYAARVRLSTPPGVEAWLSRVISRDVQMPAGLSTLRQEAVLAAGWHLEEDSQSFRTRVFNIRFCNEQISLDEVVCFGLSMNLWEGPEIQGLALEVELLFQEGDKINPSQIPDHLDLKTVSKRRIDILRPAQGMHEFLPVTFSEQYLSSTKISVHSALLGFSAGSASDSDARPERALSPERRGSLELVTDIQELDVTTTCGVSAISDESWNSRTDHLPHVKGSSRASRDLTQIIVPETGELGGLTGEEHRNGDVGDTMYFPPDRPKDIMHQDVTAQHPLVKTIEMSSMSVAGLKTGLQACEDVQGRTSSLHRAVLEPLIDTYNVLVSHLKSLPSACYAPQSLDTLRLVMLSGADQKQGLGNMNSPSSRSLLSKRLPSLNAIEEGTVREQMKLFDWRQAIESGLDLTYLPPEFVSQGVLAQDGGGGMAMRSASFVLEDLRQVTAGVLANWACLLWVARHANGQIAQVVERTWIDRRRDEWAPWVIHAALGPPDQFICRTPPEDGKSLSGTVSLACAETRLEYRNKHLRGYRSEHLPRLQDQRIFVRPHDNPILYIDDSLGKGVPESLDSTLVPESLKPDSSQVNNPKLRHIHVMVFVHGFQGNSTDLRLIKSHLQAFNPKTVCLMSKCNEGKTLDSLEGMGFRLAEEVVDFLRQFHDPLVRKRKVLAKLSFIGHSMGNLIIRSALTEASLRPYLPLLWMYISVSGPHLGYLYSKNRVFDGGLLVLKSWRNARVLHQLTFTDAQRIEDCFLYRLAMASGLSMFKHVTLLASLQDGYVPPQSARIEMCSAAAKDHRRGSQYMQMVEALSRNFGDGPGQTRAVRIDVEFYQQMGKQQWAINRLVGRKAHIEFLESDLYIQFLVWIHVREKKLLDDDPQAEDKTKLQSQDRWSGSNSINSLFTPRETFMFK